MQYRATVGAGAWARQRAGEDIVLYCSRLPTYAPFMPAGGAIAPSPTAVPRSPESTERREASCRLFAAIGIVYGRLRSGGITLRPWALEEARLGAEANAGAARSCGAMPAPSTPHSMVWSAASSAAEASSVELRAHLRCGAVGCAIACLCVSTTRARVCGTWPTGCPREFPTEERSAILPEWWPRPRPYERDKTVSQSELSAFPTQAI